MKLNVCPLQWRRMVEFHPRFSYTIATFFLDILKRTVMDLAMSNGAFFTLNTDTQREKIGQGKKSP